MATHQALIASYEKDFPFLDGCLWSLDKFSSGFLPPVVVVSSQDYEAARELVRAGGYRATVRIRDGHPEYGFMRAQLSMLEGDLHCSAEFVWLFGSDCMAHRSFRPEEYFDGDKPRLPIQTVEAVATCHPDALHWVPGTSALLGTSVRNEYMRTIPLVYPRDLFRVVRGHVERVHGEHFDAVINRRWATAGDVSESNLLGGFAFDFMPDLFSWQDLGDCAYADVPKRLNGPVLWLWSRGGLDRPCDTSADFCGSNTAGKTVREIVSIIKNNTT